MPNAPQWFPLRDLHAALSRNLRITAEADHHAIKLLGFLDVGKNSCISEIVRTEQDAEILTSVVLSYCFSRKYPAGFKLHRRCGTARCWNPYHRQSMTDTSKDYSSLPRFLDHKARFTVNGILVL